MHSILLSIGDELSLGQTLDTNAPWLAQQLAAIGYKPIAHLIVPDDQAAIKTAIEDSAPRCDVLLITGGLGPTEDDLTRQALADYLHQPLELIPEALKNVEKFFRQLKRDMPERNKIQAMLPRGTQMIENTAGTAPGIYCLLPTAHCQLFITPGVPKEMKIMFTRDILPKLRQRAASSPSSQIILSKTLHTFGLGESAVAEKLGQLMTRNRNPSVGTTVSNSYVSLRINAYFNTREKAQSELATTQALCRAALGDLVWGEDDQTLPQIVGDLLKKQKKTVTTAESCTGGLVAKYLTDIPGSSDYFRQGYITYSNGAKSLLLEVPRDLIVEHGAVSEPVAGTMAFCARRLADADYALAVSGVAGPGGGTPTKPVGTVCFGLADKAGPQTRTFLFHGDREMIRDRSAKMALTMLRYHLLGKLLPF